MSKTSFLIRIYAALGRALIAMKSRVGYRRVTLFARRHFAPQLVEEVFEKHDVVLGRLRSLRFGGGISAAMRLPSRRDRSYSRS